MGIQKFRSIEEMETAPVVVRTKDGFERFLRHCARYWAFSPRRFPRGVFKFRTIDEAQAARDMVTADNVPRAPAGESGPVSAGRRAPSAEAVTTHAVDH